MPLLQRYLADHDSPLHARLSSLKPPSTHTMESDSKTYRVTSQNVRSWPPAQGIIASSRHLTQRERYVGGNVKWEFEQQIAFFIHAGGIQAYKVVPGIGEL